MEILDKFFIFSLKSDDYFVKAEAEDAYLKAINPGKLLYCVCLASQDFIGMRQKQGQYRVKKNEVWRYPKVYCFLTYYPCVEFFQELLLSILNMIKFSRIEVLLQNGALENYSMVDGEAVISTIQSGTEQVLQRVKEKHMQDHLRVETPIAEVRYDFPPSPHVDLWVWSMCITLRNVSLSELMVSFLTILHEAPIVIVSQRLYLLTAYMYFILT